MSTSDDTPASETEGPTYEEKTHSERLEYRELELRFPFKHEPLDENELTHGDLADSSDGRTSGGATELVFIIEPGVGGDEHADELATRIADTPFEIETEGEVAGFTIIRTDTRVLETRECLLPILEWVGEFGWSKRGSWVYADTQPSDVSYTKVTFSIIT